MNNEISFDDYKKIIDSSCDELLGIMDVTLAKRAKDIVKGMLGRSVRTKDPMFWPAGMLMLGLLSAVEMIERESCRADSPAKAGINMQDLKQKALSSVSAHVDLWLRDYKGKIDFVDDALAGFCFVKAYKITGEDKYKDAADMIAKFLITAPRDDQGTIIYNPGRNSSNIFSDGIGQATMFMAAYTLAFPDSEIVSSSKSRLDASKQLKNFFEMGVDKRTGLNYHGYSLPDNQRKGLLGWGRAFGWLFMGAAEVACAAVGSTDGEDTDKAQSNNCDEKCILNSGFSVTALYRQMCDVAFSLQRPDGGWSWQMQAVDGHIDMSATGMIAYSIARGYNAGITTCSSFENSGAYNEDKKCENSAEFIAQRLCMAKKCMLSHTKDGKVMDALSSCDDFGVHYQNYGNYPWGQGAVLAAISMICENDLGKTVKT